MPGEERRPSTSTTILDLNPQPGGWFWWEPPQLPVSTDQFEEQSSGPLENFSSPATQGMVADKSERACSCQVRGGNCRSPPSVQSDCRRFLLSCVTDSFCPFVFRPQHWEGWQPSPSGKTTKPIFLFCFLGGGVNLHNVSSFLSMRNISYLWPPVNYFHVQCI